MLYVLGIIIALAVLGPLFGADSRDGLDWTPNNFWLRRRSTPDPVKPPVVPDGKGAAPRRAPPGRFQQPGDPVPMTGVGLQQFQHPGVVDLPVGQRPAHQTGQVVVADGDGVGITDRPLPNLGGRPDPDTGQRPEPRLPGVLLQPLRDPRGPDDRPGPDGLQPGPMPLPRGNPDPHLRRRRNPHMRRPRRRLPEPPQ